MTSFNIYEAYAAVYNEDLREDILSVDEEFEFIDGLSDNELDEVMEEIISEGTDISECFEVFDEIISEAKVTIGAGSGGEGVEPRTVKYGSAKVTSGRGSVMAAKERQSARKASRRAERVERIKSSVKRAAEKVKTKAAGVVSAAAGGAAEAGRSAKGIASSAKKKVTGKLAAAKERIKGAVKSGRSAVAGGLRKAASKIEPKETEKKGKEIKDAAKERISTIRPNLGVGRKERVSSAGIRSTGGPIGRSGSQGRVLPPVGKTKSGKTLTSSQRSTQTSAQNRRLSSRLGENFDLLAGIILEDLINEGYAETFEEALYVLESMSDYAVGDIAESYLAEEVETVDLYDVVLEHLLDEGYADTEDEASVIMANMSEEWRDEILETKLDPRGRPASGPMNAYSKPKSKPDQAHLDAIKSYEEKQKKKTPEQKAAELKAYRERQENR
jgi:hypothetical protein